MKQILINNRAPSTTVCERLAVQPLAATGPLGSATFTDSLVSLPPLGSVSCKLTITVLPLVAPRRRGAFPMSRRCAPPNFQSTTSSTPSFACIPTCPAAHCFSSCSTLTVYSRLLCTTSSGFRSRLGVPWHCQWQWGWRAARRRGAPVARVLTALAETRSPTEPAVTVVNPTTLQLVAQALPGAGHGVQVQVQVHVWGVTTLLIHLRVSTTPPPSRLGSGRCDVRNGQSSWSRFPKQPPRACHRSAPCAYR